MCDRCADLQAELADLRRELAYEVDADLTDQMRVRFSLTGMEALLLSALCQAKGRLLSEAALDAIMPSQSGRDRQDLHFVRVLIHRIRKKLPFVAVETLWGRGYRATPALLEARNNLKTKVTI